VLVLASTVNDTEPFLVFRQYAVCSMQYAVCSTQYAVHSMQYAVCSMQYAVRAALNIRKIDEHILKINRAIGSSVGIATGYGLDGPGIESRWGEIIRTCPDRPWGSPSLLYNGYRVFPGGRKRPERDADPSPLLVPSSENRVGLYLYSP
jgi:hypothetical protein